MAELVKADTLVLFLFFVVPGFVAMKVYDLLVPSERRNFADSLIEVVSFSMLNLAVVFWLIAEVNKPEFRSAHPVWYYLATFGVLFVAPACLAVGARSLLASGLLRGRVLHPTPTGWDFFFGKGRPCWMLFHLKSGMKLGGFYAGASFASSFPQAQDVYVEEVWRVDDAGRFVERVDRTAGALIKGEDCNLIELFTAEE